MKAPDKIYVTVSERTEILSTRRHDYDVEYIRKDALLESLKKELELMERTRRPSHIGAMVLQKIIDKINSL